MKSACFTIHPGKNPPHQNGCQLKSDLYIYIYIYIYILVAKALVSHQPEFSQNQPAAITLNTSSPQTLISCFVLTLPMPNEKAHHQKS